MSKQEFSIPQLAVDLATEADAYLFLERLRWGGTPDGCPKCGGVGRCSYLTPDNRVSRKTRTGTIVADETWIGGDSGNRHGARYGVGKGVPTDKQPVLSLVSTETGEVRSQVVPTVRGSDLRAVIDAQVDKTRSVLHTDSSKSYN